MPESRVAESWDSCLTRASQRAQRPDRTSSTLIHASSSAKSPRLLCNKWSGSLPSNRTPRFRYFELKFAAAAAAEPVFLSPRKRPAFSVTSCRERPSVSGPSALSWRSCRAWAWRAVKRRLALAAAWRSALRRLRWSLAAAALSVVGSSEECDRRPNRSLIREGTADAAIGGCGVDLA